MLIVVSCPPVFRPGDTLLMLIKEVKRGYIIYKNQSFLPWRGGVRFCKQRKYRPVQYLHDYTYPCYIPSLDLGYNDDRMYIRLY